MGTARPALALQHVGESSSLTESTSSVLTLRIRNSNVRHSAGSLDPRLAGVVKSSTRPLDDHDGERAGSGLQGQTPPHALVLRGVKGERFVECSCGWKSATFKLGRKALTQSREVHVLGGRAQSANS